MLSPSFVSWTIWVLLSLTHRHIAHRSWGASVILFTHATVWALTWAHELLTC